MALSVFEEERPLDTTSDVQPEPVTAVSGDTDWEYEYEGNETEDYYFTIDVSTYQNGQLLKPKNSGAKGQRRNGRKDSTAARQSTSRTTGTPSKTGTPQANGPVPPTEDCKLQVLDLHTDNPLIMLAGQLYSCYWSTDKGSQFYVARPHVVEAPLRPGQVLDIVGVSRARLVGRPAVARPRKADVRAEIGASAENAIALDEDGNDDDVDNDANTSHDVSLQDNPSSTKRFEMVRQAVKDPEAKAHASFLERLSMIKEKKGETDRIPIHGVKRYEPPSDKDEIRERAMAEDTELQKNGALASGRNQDQGINQTGQTSSTEIVTSAPGKKRRKHSLKSNIAIGGSPSLAMGFNWPNASPDLDPQLVLAASSPPAQDAQSNTNFAQSRTRPSSDDFVEANKPEYAPDDPMDGDIAAPGDADLT